MCHVSVSVCFLGGMTVWFFVLAVYKMSTASLTWKFYLPAFIFGAISVSEIVNVCFCIINGLNFKIYKANKSVPVMQAAGGTPQGWRKVMHAVSLSHTEKHSS